MNRKASLGNLGQSRHPRYFLGNSFIDAFPQLVGFCCNLFSLLSSTLNSVLVCQIALIVFSFCPYFADDNKPIWMHAEEREESKVSYSG